MNRPVLLFLPGQEPKIVMVDSAIDSYQASGTNTEGGAGWISMPIETFIHNEKSYAFARFNSLLSDAEIIKGIESSKI